MMQMQLYIPSRQKDIVVGELGKFDEGCVIDYGSFQSRLLFQWYQKYKDRWLKPDRKEGG